MVMTCYESPDTYYDDTNLEDLYKIPVVLENPTWRQQKEIELYKTLYRGVMLVTGKTGAGKDLFGVSFSYLNKLYFGRPILLDFRPKRAFGEYIFFDPVVFLHEINRMAKQAKFVSDDLVAEMSPREEDYFKNVAYEWLNTKGETIFRNALLYLGELKRYVPNRNPHNRMNRAIGSLTDVHRHMNMLILGTHITHKEIDYNSYLKNTSIWAQCHWSFKKLNNTRVEIRRGSYVSELGSFDAPLRPFIYWVDGAEPHSYLGGKRFYDLYNTQNAVNLKPVMPKEMAYG